MFPTQYSASDICFINSWMFRMCNVRFFPFLMMLLDRTMLPAFLWLHSFLLVLLFILWMFWKINMHYCFLNWQIVRLLANHPHFKITLMTADRKAGQPIGSVFPHLVTQACIFMISQSVFSCALLQPVYCASQPLNDKSEVSKILINFCRICQIWLLLKMPTFPVLMQYFVACRMEPLRSLHSCPSHTITLDTIYALDAMYLLGLTSDIFSNFTNRRIKMLLDELLGVCSCLADYFFWQEIIKGLPISLKVVDLSAVHYLVNLQQFCSSALLLVVYYYPFLHDDCAGLQATRYW